MSYLTCLPKNFFIRSDGTWCRVYQDDHGIYTPKPTLIRHHLTPSENFILSRLQNFNLAEPALLTLQPPILSHWFPREIKLLSKCLCLISPPDLSSLERKSFASLKAFNWRPFCMPDIKTWSRRLKLWYPFGRICSRKSVLSLFLILIFLYSILYFHVSFIFITLIYNLANEIISRKYVDGKDYFGK